VVATDLVDYGSPDQDAGGRDFLLERAAPPGVECIVTNPPFKRDLPARFAAHGLALCPKVILLCKLTFLEAERRSELFDSGVLARIYVFRDRVPMMHRADHQGRRLKKSAMAFAWFIFERDHRGPPATRWISCKS
jgi:hypothetical protein